MHGYRDRLDFADSTRGASLMTVDSFMHVFQIVARCLNNPRL